MHRFEEEDHEPVAVVRTLSDFALALTLVVLMLIGTRSAAEIQGGAETRAATTHPGAAHTDLQLVLLAGTQFADLASGAATNGLSASSIAGSWISAHPDVPATIVLRFPQQILATELHRALLSLQSAFGTHLVHIDTIPQS